MRSIPIQNYFEKVMYEKFDILDSSLVVFRVLVVGIVTSPCG